MKKPGVMLLCVVSLFLVAGKAQALPEFKVAFEKTYVATSGSAEFKAAAKKASCNICHVKGKEKDVRNVYGAALAELIPGSAKDRKKQAKDSAQGDEEKGKALEDAEKAKILKELEAAFKKVEALPSDPTNDKSPAFGDLIKQGKLPAGER